MRKNKREVPMVRWKGKVYQARHGKKPFRAKMLPGGRWRKV